MSPARSSRLCWAIIFTRDTPVHSMRLSLRISECGLLLIGLNLLAVNGALLLALAQPFFGRRALIIGASWAGRIIAQAHAEHGDGTYQVVGFVDDDPAKLGKGAWEHPCIPARWVIATRLRSCRVITSTGVELRPVTNVLGCRWDRSCLTRWKSSLSSRMRSISSSSGSMVMPVSLRMYINKNALGFTGPRWHNQRGEALSLVPGSGGISANCG